MKKFCSKPFENIAVHADGSVWMCCHDWLSTPIGNLNDSSFEDIWNGEVAKSIRRSIIDQSFSYCDSKQCPALASDSLPRVTEASLAKWEKIIAPGSDSEKHPSPKSISLTYDATCNLKCPSCRSDYIIFDRKQREQVKKIHDALFEFSLKDLERIHMTGYGDPFSSAVFRDFLRTVSREKFPSLRIALMTNALLLTPKMWESMPGAHRLIDSIHVSIDGCSDVTYSLNRGGDFSLLLENLGFIASIRRSLTIRHFEISFVVQQNNFREMPDFVRLGERLNCDKVLFQRIINWGTYTPDDFRSREVHDETHPDHEEFKHLLSSEIFASPVVDLTNLSNFRDAGS